MIGHQAENVDQQEKPLPGFQKRFPKPKAFVIVAIDRPPLIASGGDTTHGIGYSMRIGRAMRPWILGREPGQSSVMSCPRSPRFQELIPIPIPFGWTNAPIHL